MTTQKMTQLIAEYFKTIFVSYKKNTYLCLANKIQI